MYAVRRRTGVPQRRLPEAEHGYPCCAQHTDTVHHPQNFPKLHVVKPEPPEPEAREILEGLQLIEKGLDPALGYVEGAKAQAAEGGVAAEGGGERGDFAVGCDFVASEAAVQAQRGERGVCRKRS